MLPRRQRHDTDADSTSSTANVNGPSSRVVSPHTGSVTKSQVSSRRMMVHHPKYGPAKQGRLLKRAESLDSSSNDIANHAALSAIRNRRASEDPVAHHREDQRTNAGNIARTAMDSVDRLQPPSPTSSQPAVVVRTRAGGPVPLLPLAMLSETLAKKPSMYSASAPTTPMDDTKRHRFPDSAQTLAATMKAMDRQKTSSRTRHVHHLTRVPEAAGLDSILNVTSSIHIQRPDTVHWTWPDSPITHQTSIVEMGENVPIMNATPPPPTPNKPPTFSERLSPPGSVMPRRPSVSGDVPSISAPYQITPTKTAKDVLLETVYKCYPREKLVQMTKRYYTYERRDIVTDREIDAVIAKRFALFEAEFIYDDDENMTLFSHQSQMDEGNYQRRIHRLIMPNETPLFLYHNWKFARPRVSLPNQPMNTRRLFHFFIKEVSEDEYQVQVQTLSGESNREIPKTAHDLIRNQQMLYLSTEKLYKRLLNLGKEEKRAIEETRARYQQQILWLKSCFHTA